jgi:hypothetical protein
MDELAPYWQETFYTPNDYITDAADYAITSCPFLGVPPMNGRRSEVV